MPSQGRTEGRCPMAERLFKRSMLAISKTTGLEVQPWRSRCYPPRRRAIPARCGKTVTASGRLGHELDDEALFDRNGQGDLAPFGKADQPSANRLLVSLHVGRRVWGHLERLTDGDQVLARGGRLDGLARPDVRARNVHPPSVELDMAVGDELAGLRHRLGEPQAENQGVQAGLQQPKELLAGNGLLSSGLVEVPAELSLADAVDRAELLLLEQPDVELGQSPPGPAVLAGRE